MNYIVMECYPSYAILLDEDGRFLKAANLQYTVGQTVRDPVLIRETSGHRLSYAVRGGIAAAAACLMLVFGFGYYQNYLAPYSSIYLSINPEVQMDLNRQGTVVRLTGTNEDGRILLENYDGRGKDKVTVADELVDRAIEMGFLSEGGVVSFSIDAPDEVLFQEYGVELRTRMTEHLDGRISVTIELADGNEQTDLPPESSVLPESSAPEEPVSSEPATPASAPSAPSVPADTDYGPGSDGVTDYSDTDYGPGSDGVTDYTDTDYGPGSDGVTDYTDTDYGPGSDGVTGYTDTDYGPGSDGVTDYSDTDYGPGSDGVTGYSDTDYGPGSDGVTDYSDTDYDAPDTTDYSSPDRGDSDDDDDDDD